MKTASPGIDAAALTTMFEINADVLARTADGVDHATSLRAPEAGGNCMSWVLAHLIDARNGALRMVGAEPAGDRPKLERFARGSDPLTDASEAIDWSELVATFQEQRARLRERLGAMTPEDLAQPLPEDRNPFQVDNLGQMLAIFFYHESYHTGQLGVLRRVLGLDSVIK
jgi:uncharacterized damage-inducible protein DinB